MEQHAFIWYATEKVKVPVVLDTVGRGIVVG